MLGNSFSLFIFHEQPGPDSVGIVAISHGCSGVAARACGLVGLEPTRVSALGSSCLIFS